MERSAAEEVLSGVPLREIQLATDEHRLSVFVNALPVAVFVTDTTGRPYCANGLARTLLGKGADSAASSDTLADVYQAFIAGTDQLYPSERMPIVRALQGTISFVEDMEIQTPKGRVTLRVDGAPLLNAKAEVIFAIAVFRDISEERRLQSRLRTGERMASLGILAAGVAHEINNPLAYVVSNLGFALQTLKAGSGPVSAELIQALEDAREGAERVRVIVRDLKTFSRDEETVSESVDVERVMEAAINMAWHEIRHRAKLVKLFKPVPFVRGSDGRLAQVFLNLLVNAAQAIPDGAVERNKICVSTAMDESGHVVVEVRDSGPGIPPATLHRIFDPFFTTKAVGVGTGLGLAVCHSIVAGLGGEIQVETQLGKGSCFRVKLKVLEERPKPQSDPHQTPSEPSSRLKILVVDDETLMGRTLERMLRAEHDVVTAQSGKDAMERLKGGASFDLIISDLMMPEMNGMEFHAALEAFRPELARRMLFLTGGAFTDSTRRFLETINNLTLEKPVNAQTLRAAIFQCTQKGRGQVVKGST